MRLRERYVFDWNRILREDGWHIEYSVTDVCNRSCAACSHLAPLAKRENFVGVAEFARTVKILAARIPDAHTFWLTGGEPTLHPHFLRLLALACEYFKRSFVGIYSNGKTLSSHAEDEEFWRFMREKGIVWAITPYERGAAYFEELFARHGCLNGLAIVQGGKFFTNLTNYSRGEPVGHDKYEKCGWERCKINVRGGRIYNCAASEFADLFNGYFGEKLHLSPADSLCIDEHLTREKIEEFKDAMPFCAQCAPARRGRRWFLNEPSKRLAKEWAEPELLFGQTDEKNKKE